MAPVRNGRVIFKEIPKDFPVPGKTTVLDTSQTIDLDTVPLDGGFLLKTLVLSVDPYMRGRMRDASIESYSSAFTLGEPIDNFGVGVVLRSEHAAVKAGDHLYGLYAFVEYQVRNDADQFRKLENKEKLPWSVYVGTAGMPGKTAYIGWAEYSHAKKGETVFVSGGAGPVGSVVIQLAKQQGLKVIASAGSDAKVDFIKSVGADVVFNYKKTSTPEVLEKEGPVDVYWDNVGGETLEAALDAASVGARFIMCGSISGYNKNDGAGVRNMAHVFAKSIIMSGFIVGRIQSKYEDEFYRVVPAKIARGEIKYNEHNYKSLEETGRAILDVQTGRNEGKAVIVLADN